MSLSNPRVFFGVHSFTPYDRQSGLPYGTALVIGQSGFSLSGELASLQGGSNKYPWAVEETNINAELSLTVKQYEDWMFQLFLGKKPTATGVSNGEIRNLEGRKGNLIDAIASVSVSTEGDVKFAKYVVKVVDVAGEKVDVYALSNVDFARGTDKDYEDDLLKINASPLTVTDAGVTIPGFGIKITGVALTDFAALGIELGDTISFEAKPAQEKSIQARFGASSDNFPVFGAIVTGQQRGSGEMVELDIFALKAVGLPLGFQEKSFSEAEITAQAFYDSKKNGVFDLRHITPQGLGL